MREELRGSLALLVVQNSATFVVTRYTRSPDRTGPMYLSSAVGQSDFVLSKPDESYR